LSSVSVSSLSSALRVLHSFPTRRSSDLRELGTVGEVSIEGGDRLFGASALEEGVAVAVVRVRVLRVELDDSRPVGGCLLVTAEARADLRAQAMSSDALR